MKHWLPSLVALLTSFPCPAETLGRLFFTPEQRLSPEQSAGATLYHSPGRHDGHILSPSGQQVHWIDGNMRADAPPATPVGDSLAAPLLPPGSMQRHRHDRQ